MIRVDRSVSTRIETSRCIGCGACVAVCPAQTLRLVDGKAVVAGAESLACGHCAAACPQEAVTVEALDPVQARFATFEADPRWLPPGRSDLAQLARLMASRRSCRNFTGDPVPLARLEDLVRIGITAPSGSNCQPWTFTLLPDRTAVLALAREVAAFFARLNRRAESAWLRWLLRVAGRPQLDFYFRNYHDAVAENLSQWEQTGCDRLFHGAPAAMVVASRPASCPIEDCLLATGQILLAAHAMGLGTCLIGFAVSALQHDRAIPRRLGLGPDETVRAVIALGHPAEAYRRPAGRRAVTVRRFAGHKE
jgi:nitroreductase/NAD-dependent dihydropyrimidine dehydrogenase PreA subunit